ncbi:Uu.00g090610.m01.CDS01 [Anthostomella pinea]|uniref:Uu.00g090610.m01.CDS01 n=1 Tax=Anthostomella pinea TaxID=933095 RepID=A0AAI8YKA1_9PEZI|nr:Uu.00g090610.m01.CDS01 [Anthostomella pinea]
MFAKPRPKKSLLPPPRKRKVQHAIEEVKFDDEARTEYLTGFHKRKLQRTKDAQAQAAKRARQEKLDLRKQIREDRKREVVEHVQQVNAMLKEAQQAGHVGGEEGTSDDEADEWDGLEDAPEPEPVDHEEEYIDEERYTTVTVESVTVSRDGLTSSKPEEEESETEDEEGQKADREAGQASGSSGKSHPPKKKKPKFRYETKMERQQTRRKQKAKSNSKRPPRD